MKPDLVLVANAADARLYTRDAGDRKLHLLDTLASPQSRLQPRDLASKPLGHERSSRRTEGVLFTPRIDAQRKRHLAFARQLAQRIDAALQTHAYDGVVLFAACPFLGTLKGQLDRSARKLLRVALPVDFTHFEHGDLQQRIDDELRAESADAH